MNHFILLLYARKIHTRNCALKGSSVTLFALTQANKKLSFT